MKKIKRISEMNKIKESLAKIYAYDYGLDMESARVHVAVAVVGAASETLADIVHEDNSCIEQSIRLSFLAQQLKEAHSTLEGYFYDESN